MGKLSTSKREMDECRSWRCAEYESVDSDNMSMVATGCKMTMTKEVN